MVMANSSRFPELDMPARMNNQKINRWFVARLFIKNRDELLLQIKFRSSEYCEIACFYPQIGSTKDFDWANLRIAPVSILFDRTRTGHKVDVVAIDPSWTGQQQAVCEALCRLRVNGHRPLMGPRRHYFWQKKATASTCKRRPDDTPNLGNLGIPKFLNYESLPGPSRIRKAELQADIAVRDDSDNRETLEFKKIAPEANTRQGFKF